jgi:hypothetical protein
VIDFSNEIFNAVAKHLRSLYKGIQVKGEYVATPAKFPTVTIDEISNIPVSLDSATTNKYADVLYRVQVFSNKENGKRAEAREIYKSVDEKMMELGLFAKSYTSTPTIYNSEVYTITAIFGGIIGENGVIYRN